MLWVVSIGGGVLDLRDCTNVLNFSSIVLFSFFNDKHYAFRQLMEANLSFIEKRN